MGCCGPLLLLAVAGHCYYGLLLTTVAMGYHCPLLILPASGHYCYWMLWGTVAMGCCGALLLWAVAGHCCYGLPLAAVAVPVGCSHQQWLCQTGFCIDLTKLCDGYVDCEDASDETNCGMCTTLNALVPLGAHPSGFYRLRNIPFHFKKFRVYIFSLTFSFLRICVFVSVHVCCLMYKQLCILF